MNVVAAQHRAGAPADLDPHPHAGHLVALQGHLRIGEHDACRKRHPRPGQNGKALQAGAVDALGHDRRSRAHARSPQNGLQRHLSPQGDAIFQAHLFAVFAAATSTVSPRRAWARAAAIEPNRAPLPTASTRGWTITAGGVHQTRESHAAAAASRRP